MSRLYVVAFLLAAIGIQGCAEQSERLTFAEEERITQSVHAMAEHVAEDLAMRGPIAWLDHFADVPEFFMASDGALVFPDYQSASTFVSGFAPSISDMELTWKDVHVDPIEERLAIVAASYDESLTDTTGATVSFGGYFTALAVETSVGWRFKNLHWSSPARSD